MSQPHIVLGVCGGVSAYKAVEVCRRLKEHGNQVSVIMTPNANRFIGETTFAALSGEPVRSSLWDSPEPSPHTSLGQSADLIAVVPATARLIGAYANGLCNDLLSTTLVATRAPVIIVPAMHTEMWEHPAVVANVALLKGRGVQIVGPEDGPLAGGDSGPGRLADPAAIVSAIQEALKLKGSANQDAQDMRGISVLVTAGGTREPIDPVRFIGNRSSGKQGIAIALDAASRGASVHLISTVDGPPDIRTTRVATADEMHDACMQYLSEADVVVMAAAIADFRPKSPAEQKIKKSDGTPQLELVPTVDVLTDITKASREDQTIVGFAAETNDIESHGLQKLKAKNLDAIVVNDVSRTDAGFEVDTNVVSVFDKSGQVTHCSGEKRTVAHHINDLIVRLRRDSSA